MSGSDHPSSLWILTDGKAGDEGPLAGIAFALGVRPRFRRVSPGAPWSWAMPFGPIPPGDRPGRPKSPIAPPFPDVCLATGRRAVAYLRAVKSASPQTFTVFYKDPRTTRHGADLIVVQAHDGLSGEGIMTVTTGPHRLSAARLTLARSAPPIVLSALPKPRVAVLVGGDSRHHRFTDADVEAFVDGLERWRREGATLMVTPSRRTPPALRQALDALGRRSGVFVWNGEGENPLASILALAQAVVVTADSTNMIGEAAAAGRPIHVFHPFGGHRKIRRFLADLATIARVRAFPGRLDVTAVPPVDSTPAIAARILAEWRARREGVSPAAPPDRP